ncbi:hypothetical protein BDN72DRAFT_875758 [Pluteus cervinus]|uniref:Uncharacterized protein n=1 Tax=Pluteus cervinus TaxID=181527 RepID=A0ACD3B7L1_9AGAR|nr:hypothetical protein BDN72DRAFT_875758 [Pluteus cervinus]
MSRLSRANLKARESIFATGPDIYRGEIHAICPPDLEECVMALEDCCDEAYEAQMLLRNGTRDFPRMSKVLESHRFFLLVNEATISKYKADLVDEIEPAINKLVANAEEGLRLLEKQETLLQKQVSARSTSNVATASQQVEARRLQQLKKQRKKLEDEALELEAEVEQLTVRLPLSRKSQEYADKHGIDPYFDWLPVTPILRL